MTSEVSISPAGRRPAQPGVAPWELLTVRRSAALLMLIVLAALGLRYYGLGVRSLWFDEAFSWRLAEFPVGELIERVGHDNHTPFYFLLLKGWSILFGTSEAALRGLSGVLGCLTVIGVYLCVVEALRQDDGAVTRLQRRCALVAAVLVAVNVAQIRWDREVRMYSLGTCLAAFSSWMMFRAVRAPAGAIRPWVLYGSLLLLLAYTHYTAPFTILAQALFLTGLAGRRAWVGGTRLWRSPIVRGGLVAAAIVVFGWLPWLPTFLAQRAQVRAHFWLGRPDFEAVTTAFWRLLIEPEEYGHTPFQGVVVLPFVVAVTAGMLWCARAGMWYLFLAFVVPVVGCLWLSQVGDPVFHCRYLLFAHLFFLAGLGVLLGRIRWNLLRWAVLVGVVGGALALDVRLWQRLNPNDKPGTRAALALVNSRRLPGEPVLVASPLLYFPVLYYVQNRHDCHVLQGANGIPHYLGLALLSPDEAVTVEQISSIRSGRVWVVNQEGPSGLWHQVVSAPQGWEVLESHRFREVCRFQGEVVVVVYQVGAEASPQSAH